MKVLLIGLGSIAGRHIQNLKEILGDGVSITVLRSGYGSAAKPEIVSQTDVVCYDEESLDSRYDAVFITNPASLHYDTLRKYQRLSDCFFIEKPVFMTGNEDLGPFRNDQKIYYTACPLRYCGVIQYLKSHIDFSAVYSMRCISSSYLPDWRPQTDYRRSYSAHRDMGGGVSIDLIHEWDYIQYLAGPPQTVKSLIRKKSGLETDSDDIAVYIAEYEDKLVEIHLDYFGRRTIRRLELFMRDDTVVADLLNQKIEWLREGRQIAFSSERDDYQKQELIHFLDMINGTCGPDSSLEDACRILRTARGME